MKLAAVQRLDQDRQRRLRLERKLGNGRLVPHIHDRQPHALERQAMLGTRDDRRFGDIHFERTVFHPQQGARRLDRQAARQRLHVEVSDFEAGRQTFPRRVGDIGETILMVEEAAGQELQRRRLQIGAVHLLADPRACGRCDGARPDRLEGRERHR
jgi:hypothetical protein